jgi:hypothetical protein
MGGAERNHVMCQDFPVSESSFALDWKLTQDAEFDKELIQGKVSRCGFG